MPTAVIDLPAPVEPQRKRWTRDECSTLVAAFPELERLELIDGDLIDKGRKSWAHVVSTHNLLQWAWAVFGSRFVHSGAPVDVNPTDEPEPDLIVLTRDMCEFPVNHPGPQDLRLLIEVADSTFSFDLNQKAALYARANIQEYWVLDIAGRRLIVHREPKSGRFTSISAYSQDESVAPIAAPDSPFLVRNAFPD